MTARIAHLQPTRHIRRVIVIEKNGTGIERNGTGIEKNGTGIEKNGTGITGRTDS